MNILMYLGNRSRLLIVRICRVFSIFSASIIILIMFIIVYEVIARYLFNRPTSWAMEISQHILVAPVFLAAGYTMLLDAHVNISSVIGRLPKMGQAIINIITLVMALPFLAILTWNLFGIFLQAYERNWSSMGAFYVPLAPVYLTMTIGCLMFFLATLVRIGDHALSLKAQRTRGKALAPV